MRAFLFLLVFLTPVTLLGDDKVKNKSFSFPDEWGKHSGTILTFPTTLSYGVKARALQAELAALANAIVKNEPVFVFVHPKGAKRAKSLLSKEITLIVGADYRIDWARDTAPLITKNDKGQRRAVCFQFNGWGKKYSGWKKDQGVNLAMSKYFKLPVIKSELVLEGGAIEIGSTSMGLTGIVTEQCVLNRNRTNWSRAKIEKELKSKLGLSQVIWLKKGLNPDPVTDGHVDGLLKFIAKDTVLLHSLKDRRDVNYKTCVDAKRQLKKAGLTVIDLPLARDIVHMNFYIGTEGKVAYVPICGDAVQDKPALKIIGEHFKTVVPLKSLAFSKAGGGIHCQTQQIPDGK